MQVLKVVLILVVVVVAGVAWRLFADSVRYETRAPLFRVWRAHRKLRRAMFRTRLRPEYYYRSRELLFFRYPYSLRPRFRYLRIESPGRFEVGDVFPAQLLYISWWWPAVFKRKCRVFVDGGTCLRVFDPEKMEPLNTREYDVLSPLEVQLLTSEIRVAQLTSRVRWQLPDGRN